MREACWSGVGIGADRDGGIGEQLVDEDRATFGTEATVKVAHVRVALRSFDERGHAGVNVLLWAMIAYETAHYDERRYQLRHGVDPESPSSPGSEGA